MFVFYIYIYFLIFKKYITQNFLKFVNISNYHTIVIGEPLQSTCTNSFVVLGVLGYIALHLDYLESFINYFHNFIIINNVEVINVSDKLSFNLTETLSTEEKCSIINTLERTDSMILNRFSTVDNLVERAIELHGDQLDDPDSALSFQIGRLKNLQLQYKYY
jgi:hypothetical protein